jgi:hypothetical protein
MIVLMFLCGIAAGLIIGALSILGLTKIAASSGRCGVRPPGRLPSTEQSLYAGATVPAVAE